MRKLFLCVVVTILMIGTINCFAYDIQGLAKDSDNDKTGVAAISGTCSGVFTITSTNTELFVAVNGIIDTAYLVPGKNRSAKQIVDELEGQLLNVHPRVYWSPNDICGIELISVGNTANIKVIAHSNGAETACGLVGGYTMVYAPRPLVKIDSTNTDPVQANVVDKTYLETFIVGTGSTVMFPTSILETQTYHGTAGLKVLASTNIESAGLGNNYIYLDFDVVSVSGAYFAGTITSQVFERVESDSITPYYFTITFTDSKSTIAGTQETIAYFVRTGSTNPPIGAWTSYTSGTSTYCKDEYVQWYAYLTTSESPTLSPTITRANLDSRSYYDGGFKVYAIGASVNNTVDSTTLDMDIGATSQTKINFNMLSGIPNLWDFNSPVVFSDTAVITVGNGMGVLIQYLPK
jgi:hypothetical protein